MKSCIDERFFLHQLSQLLLPSSVFFLFFFQFFGMLIFRGNTDWHLVSNNKQYSLTCIFGSLHFYTAREISIFSSSSSARLPDGNIVRLCCLEKS